MMYPTAFRRATLVTLVSSTALAAQVVDHAGMTAGKLGTVHFPTSCAPAVTPQFDRAMALLHSFEFGTAIRTFSGVLAADSSCAMAAWGLALSRWTNPMTAANRSPALLEQGRQFAALATRLGARATDRERAYIAAAARLYADYEHTTQRSRIEAYETAMAEVAATNSSDTEAKTFYAIALVAAAQPTDKSYAKQLKAGAMLEELWKSQPDHPGLAHYIIHAYDVPALASHASRAAARYSEIAPSAAHALHMPSHTFTRVGLWQESVRTNQRSVEAAMRDSSIAEALHASDYMEYAYLQMRRDAEAKAVLDGLPALVARFDPNVVSGAASGSSGVFALAAIPARYALERRDWAAASGLTPNETRFPYADAITWFVRALGAAHTGDRERARSATEALEKIQRRLVTDGELYWAEQVAIQVLEARATLDRAEARDAEAMAKMAEAVTREDATEKNAVTPGPLAPARELLGDMLMDAKRPADAIAEYRKSLAKEPKRYRSVFGAMLAARATGDRKAEAQYSQELTKLTGTKP